jgi:hypothetical protein
MERPAAWPVIVAIAVFAVDQFGTASLAAVGVRGWWFLGLSILIGIVAVGYGYWFLGRFAADMRDSIPAQATAQDFRDAGLLVRLKFYWEGSASLIDDMWSWFVERLHDQLSAKGRFKQWILKISLALIRSTHVWMTYPVLIGLGLLPLGWIIGVIVCRAHPVRGGLGVLMTCNAIKTYVTGQAVLAGLVAVGM